jgi:MoxR-like ATPase
MEQNELNYQQEVEMDTQIPVLPVDYAQYDPSNVDVWEKYVEIADEKQRLTESIMNGEYPFLIESEKGQGKTLLVHTVCKENKIALIEDPVGVGTKKSDLIGSKEINKDGTFFTLGILPKAIMVANYFKHAVLYCDEGNNQEHEIQQWWHSICDGRNSIVANGKRYSLNEGCKLSIVWTINPVTYAGVNSMTEAMRSRFIGMAWNYPSNEDMAKVINWTDIDDATVKQPLLTLAQDIYALKLKGEIDYALSIRDLAQYTDHLRTIEGAKKVETALKEVVLIKYAEPSERELVRLRINDTFNLNI